MCVCSTSQKTFPSRLTCIATDRFCVRTSFPPKIDKLSELAIGSVSFHPALQIIIIVGLHFNRERELEYRVVGHARMAYTDFVVVIFLLIWIGVCFFFPVAMKDKVGLHRPDEFSADFSLLGVSLLWIFILGARLLTLTFCPISLYLTLTDALTPASSW